MIGKKRDGTNDKAKGVSVKIECMIRGHHGKEAQPRPPPVLKYLLSHGNLEGGSRFSGAGCQVGTVIGF